MGRKDECVWEVVKRNDECLSARLYLGFNILQGVLACGLFSLVSVTFFDTGRNVFEGAMPNRTTRLPMTCLDTCKNVFAGTLPSGFCKIDGIEYLS